MAELLLQEMACRHLEPSVACFNATLTAYGNALQWEAALHLLFVLDQGLKADFVSLGACSHLDLDAHM